MSGSGRQFCVGFDKERAVDNEKGQSLPVRASCIADASYRVGIDLIFFSSSLVIQVVSAVNSSERRQSQFIDKKIG